MADEKAKDYEQEGDKSYEKSLMREDTDYDKAKDGKMSEKG